MAAYTPGQAGKRLMNTLARHALSLLLLLILAHVAFSQSRPEPQADKPTGSISGRVTIGDKGAAGIVVSAFSGDMPTRRTAGRTTTDSEGRYRLFGLPAAQYQVTTLAPAFTSAEPGVMFSGLNYDSGKRVVLAANETVEDVDIKLVRGGVITGRVTESDGKPVVEQHISLQPVDQNGAIAKQAVRLPLSYQMYQTDDRGVYRIYGLAAGFYKVSTGNDADMGMVNSSNHAYYAQTFYPDVNDPAKAKVVEVGEGSEVANIDIRLGHRANTYSATGRVVDADTDQPVTGVRFGYGPAPKNQGNFNSYFAGLPLNSRGEFRIDGLEPGRYGIVVSSQFGFGGNIYSDPVFFEVVDSNVSNLEVKAIRGLSMTGVVLTDGIANKDLLVQLGTLIISANVSSPNKPQTSNYGSSRIGADGSFQINGLRSGRAGLYIYAAGNQSLRGVSITKIEHDGVDVTKTLEIQPGQSVSGLRVFVIVGTGAIRGTVTFEGGAVPPDLRIFVRIRREGAANFGEAQPDTRGHFLISNLAAGTYEVDVQLLSNQSVPAAQRPTPPQKQLVSVADDAETEVAFTVDLKPKEGGP